MEETVDISSLPFPQVQEGERALHNEKWYVYTNGTWVEETN